MRTGLTGRGRDWRGKIRERGHVRRGCCLHFVPPREAAAGGGLLFLAVDKLLMEEINVMVFALREAVE